MKIYFNNLGIETSRVLDDVFVKNDVGRRIEAYFDGVNISSANISARLIIEWPNGDTTNALIMTKFIDASGFYIILPQLIQDGTATFTIRITNLLEDYLQNTPQFTREILESVDAADDTNITPAEYAAMQEAINENASNIIASLNAAKNYSDAQLNARLRVLNVDDISDENTILELYSDLHGQYEETGEAIKFNFVGAGGEGYKYLGNVNADFGESGDPMWITFFKDGSIYYYFLHDTGEEIDVKAVQFEARNTTTTLTNEDKLITSAAVKAVTDLCARNTYVDALIQQITDGTTLVKRAECDKEGDDITTKYAKVDGNNVYTGFQRFDDAVITIPLADQPTKPVRLSQLQDAIGKLEDGTTIADKAKKDRLGNVIDATYAHTIVIAANSSTYQYTFSLLDAQGNTLNSQVIDLPLENVVVGGEYDGTNKAIILTLDNGQEIEIPVADLVAGLQPTINEDNPLPSNYVDDYDSEYNKFVTPEEKAQITANKNEIADVREIAVDALDRTSVHDDEILFLNRDLDNVEARLDTTKFNKSDVDTSIANPTSDTKVLSEKVVVNELNKVNDQIDILKVRVRDLEKNVFDVVEDNTTKYQKVIPNNVLTYGGLSKLGGLTKKYNQLAKSMTSANWGFQDATGTFSDEVCAFTSSAKNGQIYQQIQVYANHKYLLLAEIKLTTGTQDVKLTYGVENIASSIASTEWQLLAGFINITTTVNSYALIKDERVSDWDAIQARNYMMFDLTDSYGAGNEPTTVDQFLTDYPIFRGYVPYTTGAMDYAYTKKVDITGLNVWDEVAEVGGISASTGANETNANTLRSKNYIDVISNKTYCFKCVGDINLYFYDESKNFISATQISANTTYTMPANCYYLRFRLSTTYGTTYNHDICINVSNTTLNGTYKPSYRNTLLEAKIVAIKQKLVGLGYSADVLGYGLNNVYNYIDLENKQVVLKMINVDLGEQTWGYTSANRLFSASLPLGKTTTNILCSLYTPYELSGGGNDPDKCVFVFQTTLYITNSNYTDSATFKTAMSGVPLIYELATPVTVDVSDILDNDDVIGELESGGTITFENDNRYNLPSNVTYLVEVE